MKPTQDDYRQFSEYLDRAEGKTENLGAARGIIAEMQITRPASRNLSLERDLADSHMCTSGEDATAIGLMFLFLVILGTAAWIVITNADKIDAFRMHLWRML